MSLEKPKFYEEKKEFVYAMAFLLSLLLLRLFFSYQSYTEFTSKPFYFTHATVLNAYEKVKHGKRYTVLKLRADEGFTFYTTTHKKEDFSHTRVRIEIFPNSGIAFRDYLGTFYVKSRIKERVETPNTFKDLLLSKVSDQHEDASIASFYNAIFFATAVDQKLREKIALLGVSHLVALSGFHLTILWGLIYGLLLLLYRPVQQKKFPYRFALIDVGAAVMLLLGLYLWFVDFPPSLLRSYAMVFTGWVLLCMGIELLSFTFLATIILVLLVLFPSLLVSLGFWLSVSGVFYIFLLLQYTVNYPKWMIMFLVIPVGIFLLMQPFVHSIFGMTSAYQLLSPLLSLLFIVFYPLLMFLHLLGLGGIFDGTLLWLFSLPTVSVEHILPFWAWLVYMALSLAAIWSRKLFYALLGSALGYAGYLFL